MKSLEIVKKSQNNLKKEHSTADRLQLQFDDNQTIYVNATSQLSSKVSSPVAVKHRPLISNQSSEYSFQSKKMQTKYQTALSSIPEKPYNQVFKFEIHIDREHGTQLLQVYNKDTIKETVDRFAIKYGIRNQSKVRKLYKLVGKEIRKRETEEEPKHL